MIAICGLLGGCVAEGLDAMLASLADFDAATTWTEGSVGLGVRAMGTEESRAASLLGYDCAAGVAAVADARLDDRDTLCEALGIPPSERTTIRAVDLIIGAYIRWGRACPSHLLGDYAFVVWDARQRTLFCARDHVGARPFYYAATPNSFIFASTVEAVLAAPGVSDALDETTAATYLTSADSLPMTPRTFFAMVRKLLPGHTLTLAGDAKVRIERYWRPENVPRARPASDDAYAQAFLDLYTRAVRDRLRGAPDPVGVHLSGGLDSSSIAVLAARELRRQGRPAPIAFSWFPPLGPTPPKAEYAPEYAHIDAVCEQEGLQVRHQSPTVDEMVALLRQDGTFPGTQVHYNEDPVQRRAAALGVRVILSGWGGDEGASFNGNGYKAHLLLTGQWGKLLDVCRARGAPVKLLAKTVLMLVHPRLWRTVQKLWRRDRFIFQSRRFLVDPTFARLVRILPRPVFRPVGVRRTQLHLLGHGHLVERIEGWAASGARRNIIYRYPLLDRRVLEFALSLPPDQFQRGRYTRWLMRHALHSVLPPEVCWNQHPCDSARTSSLLNTIGEALPIVKRDLVAQPPPPRARYVDIPRLLHRMDTERLWAKPKFMPILKALQFLDFH